MALDSTSTYEDALLQYDSNLVWENDPAKAILALEALRWMLVHRPMSQSAAGRLHSYASLMEEIRRLEDFVALTGSNRAEFTRGVPYRRYS